MADLSGLNLKGLEPTNWDEYPPGGGIRKRPHEPGRYMFKSPSFKDIKFDAQDGYLRFVNKATIVGPDPDRDDTVYDYVSNKPYAKGKRKGASRMGDYLLSVGVERENLPGTDHEHWAELVEQSADSEFPALLDWDCYDSEMEKSVADSVDDFPDDPNHPGQKLPYMEVTRPDGSTKRLTARQRIRFYVFERQE